MALHPPSFDTWIGLVNEAVLERTCGLGRDDLVDWDYASAFEAGMSPEDAAFEAISNDPTGRQLLALEGEAWVQ